MALVICKSGVNSDGIASCRIAVAIGLAIGLLHSKGFGCVVTSLNDGNHMTGSKHYVGLAADFRTHHLSSEVRDWFHAEMKHMLDSNGYDIVLESAGQPNEHLHVEFDPKDGEEFIGVDA